MSGKFITLEGGEGCGKSTQTKLLSEALKKLGVDVVATKEPGGTPDGAVLRNLLVTGDKDRFDAITECMLYFADRRIHLNRVIWPALEQNKWVISDRYADSTEAYQYFGYNKRISRETLRELYQMVAGDFKPDLTIILDIEPERGMARSFAKAEKVVVKELRFENKALEFHNNLREGFRQIAAREPERCVIINADKSVEEVHAEIMNIVKKRFSDEFK
ncbi:MAG: dTMP kinase [Alphaproteobacteria bacterium]|nr:dTMP kinase [Alphaproteobacteria bacterium]